MSEDGVTDITWNAPCFHCAHDLPTDSTTTEAQLAAVAAVLDEARSSNRGISGPHLSRQWVIDALMAAISDPDASLANVRARAWNEGLQAGLDDYNGISRPNPYREATS